MVKLKAQARCAWAFSRMRVMYHTGGGARASTAVDAPPENALEMMARGQRITVEQYHKMHEAGIYMEGDRVELIEGYVLEKHLRNAPQKIRYTRGPEAIEPGRHCGHFPFFNASSCFFTHSDSFAFLFAVKNAAACS